MSYRIKLEAFEGPLDLLLHLIEKEEIDIYDIPIAHITQQYLDYLSAMEELDLEVASDFLVMAATLLEIKARWLLPSPPPVEGEEDAELIDPREELVERLLEYKRFKEAAEHLRQLEEAASRHVPRPAAEIPWDGEADRMPQLNVSLAELIQALQEVLARLDETEEILELDREEVTVGEKMGAILDRLGTGPGGLAFVSLFPQRAAKIEIIVTFLALLELIRRRQAVVRQGELFGPIMVYGM